MKRLKRPKIFIVSGPSGSGKTTIIRELLKKRNFERKFFKTVSYTTRPKRGTEKDGKDYYFVSPSRFQALVKRNFFLEWMPVFRHSYGTPRAAVRQAHRQQKSLLLCIDVKGALRVRQEYPGQAVLIFILPPSIKELEQRLRARTTETAQELQMRLRVARKEITVAKKYDYCIINDTLPEAVYALECILTAEELRRC